MDTQIGIELIGSCLRVPGVGGAITVGACAFPGTSPPHMRVDTEAREHRIASAQLWTKTDVAAMDLTAGPQGPGAFAPGQTVVCDYVDETLEGSSPKFSCLLSEHDKLNVKSDRQMHDLFEVARFPLRTHDGETNEGQSDTDAWVRALKDKIDQVVHRSCAPKLAESKQ